jgi:hypothetical protein
MVSDKDIAPADRAQYLASLLNMNLLALNDSSGMPSIGFVEAWCKRTGWINDGRGYKIDELQAAALEESQRVEAFGAAAMVAMPGRRVFRTTEGHIGLADESIKVGDGVWAVSGCPSPLVLRETDVVDDDPTLRYNMICEVFVHGIMHGEAVSEETKWNKVIII